MSRAITNRKKNISFDELIYSKLYTNNKSGGFVIAHKKHDRSKLSQNLSIAKQLADRGEIVELIESIPNEKSPDAKRNELFWKFRTVSSSQNLENSILMAIRKSKRNCENMLIYIDQPFSMSNIFKALETSISKDKSDKIRRIDILMQRRLMKFTRDDILQGNHKKTKKPDLCNYKEPVSLEGHPKTTSILDGSVNQNL